MRPSQLLAALGVLLLVGAVPAAAQAPTSRPKITQPPPNQLPDLPARKPAEKTPAAAKGAAPAGAAGDGIAYLQGVAIDSIHGAPLVNAVIQLQGSDRIAVTDSLGRFLADSVKPGSYKILVDHPILDTLGIALSTEPMQFVGNEVTRVVVAVPSPDFLAERLCPANKRALGPGVVVGRVREPDSEMPAIGARVSIVWYDPEPTALKSMANQAGIAFNAKKTPRVRETTVGEDGTYRLCGLPEKYEGKLQAQRKDGGQTAEVSIVQDGGLLAMRSMSVAPLVVAKTTGDSVTKTPVRKGTARAFGRVVNKAGAPVPSARVSLVGTGAATLTRANGEFSLDSLPAGTQALSVRHLGYAPKEVAVELSSRAPARVNVQLGDYVPELEAVEVVSQMEQGLDRVGYTSRKRGVYGGSFIGPEQIENRHASQFTDLLTTTPGIRVEGTMGRSYITSTRTVGGQGCVRIFVDNNPWQQLEAGDLDAFVQPSEVAAIEIYPAGSMMPVEFQTSGSDCSAVVVWTKVNVNRRTKKK
jgi:hypothetical protein